MADAERTVERHLSGRPPEIVALYHRFIELADACGPFTYSVAKSPITLKGARRGFAGAIRASGELDDEFAGWIHEAYQVGNGAHLGPRPHTTLAP